MAQLTAEQKLKIEDNKRKALALRAARKQNETAGQVNNILVPANYNNSSQGTVLSPSSVLHPGGRMGNCGGDFQQRVPTMGLHCLSQSQNGPNKQGPVCGFYGTPGSENNQNSQFSPSEPRTLCPAPGPQYGLPGSVVKGSCVLVKKNRFEVQVNYHGGLVELFKTMETRQYDPETKNWSFELKEYHNLLSKARRLGQCVKVEPLPRCVLQTFAPLFQGRELSTSVSKADLSNVDAKLVNTLMPFQHDGVNFGIHHKGRVLVADDMGLGKTIQALCMAVYFREEWPLLIVVPSSVKFAWRDQILTWIPSIKSRQVNVVVKGRDDVTDGDINILSYDMMSRRHKELEDFNFQVIIMDESHLLKNSRTARTKSAMPILKKARRVILLSGTPALSRPSELFSQLNAIDSKVFPYFTEFGIRYCDGKQHPWGWDFSGSSNMSELKLVLEQRIMIRRLKKDVLSQLPTKQRKVVMLDPASVKLNKATKASHKLMEQVREKEMKDHILQYYHQAGIAKTKAVTEYVEDLIEADRKFLVFAHHSDVMDALEKAVSKKCKFIRIDGKTAPEQRNHLVGKFQTNDDVRVAILSITAANAGLNLTAAAMVVFAELFWNPGVLVQAEDRVHRIGQQDCVNVQYLVARGTADDYMWPLVQKKLNVLGQAGLSKDNFEDSDVTQAQDPKQRNIMSYFEESFFEDETAENQSLDSTAGETESGISQYFSSPEEPKHEPSDSSSGTTAPPTGDDSSKPPEEGKAAPPAGDLKQLEEDHWGPDFLDDLYDDMDPDEPWPKKPRL